MLVHTYLLAMCVCLPACLTVAGYLAVWLSGYLADCLSVGLSVCLCLSVCLSVCFGPNRVGRPKAHWAESRLVEASRRLDVLQSDVPPPHFHIDHDVFSIPTSTQIRPEHSLHSIVWMDNTHPYRRVSTVARHRALWASVVLKPSRKTPKRS